MKIITLCGSTKFKAEFEAKNKELTLAGNIVISVACFGHSGDTFTDKQKTLLDEIHKRKIDLADAIYVINKNGYIGSSTQGEIEYAQTHGKEILYMETPANPCVSCDMIKVRCENCSKVKSKPPTPTHGSNARPPQRGLEIGIHIDNLKSIIRKETLEEVFGDMYRRVTKEEKHCNVTISGADIKAIAKRYGVEVGKSEN